MGLILLLAGCASGPGTGLGQDVAWKAEGEAVVRLLKELVRFDTSEGNETALCRHVQAWLKKNGVKSEIIESAPGRGNLIARYKGNGSQRPLLLMAHIDVVGVDREKWTTDPFEPVEARGYLQGRGVIDDKGMGATIVQLMILLHRLKPELSRDVIIMLNADEESGSGFGADYVTKHHWDRIDAEFVLNEGGRIFLKDGKVSYLGVQAAEKVYNDVRLWLRGVSGHSSVPLPKNALYDLAEVLVRLRDYRTPIALTETVRANFAATADNPENAKLRALMKLAAGGDRAAARKLAGLDPRLNALLRTTIAPTIVKGGIRVNVLPPDVELNLNIRLIPGDNLMHRLKDIARHVGLEEYAVIRGKDFADWRQEQEKRRRSGKRGASAAFVIDTQDAEAPPSPLGTDLYKAIEKVAEPLGPVVPFMSTGATDSRWFRSRGVTAYGIVPMPMSPADRKGVHGHNERIRIKSLHFGIRFLHDLVIEAAR